MSMKNAFSNVEPFRSNVLRMLLPSDISSLLAALCCSVSPWERTTHMDIMHEVFQDIQELRSVQNLGLSVRIFGSDLESLHKRIRNPWALDRDKDSRCLYLFLLISKQCLDGSSTLNEDFRGDLRGKTMVEDMDIDEMAGKIPEQVTGNIKMLSRWMLCTPHPAGSLPSTVPGWFPMFNTRQGIALRTYMASYRDYRAKILYMDRTLMRKVFGYQYDTDLLANVSNLTAMCHIFHSNNCCTKTIFGRLTTNTIRDVYKPSQSQEEYVIVNAIQPLDSAIIFRLP